MTPKLLEKALKSAGGLEEFKRKSDQFSRDLAFIDENRDKLLKDYDEKWVAVYESKVVAYGKHYNNVLSQLERNDLSEEQVVIKFLSSREAITLYPER